MRIIPEKISRLLKLLILKFTKKNISFGKNVLVDFKTKIYNNKNKVILGGNVLLRSNPVGYQAAMPYPTTILIDIKGAEVNIGENTRINGAYIHAQKLISIGKNCVIASGVNILDSNGHIVNSPNRTQGRDIPSEIIIGDNVWIGMNCIILKGTIIGKNSVISAGSVVKGIYPEDSLIQGNIAKVIKKLNIEH